MGDFHSSGSPSAVALVSLETFSGSLDPLLSLLVFVGTTDSQGILSELAGSGRSGMSPMLDQM